LRRAKKMVQGEGASVLQCPCGHAILCRIRHLGERLGALAFYDYAATNETYAQRIESCPGCGQTLEFLRLYVETLTALFIRVEPGLGRQRVVGFEKRKST
jgi:hypothetical protein